jgi:hypothetical protein
MVNAPLKQMAVVLLHRERLRCVWEPGGRALPPQRPPCPGDNGNLAGASCSPEFAPAIFVRQASLIGKAMDAVREIVNSEKE